MLFVNYQKQATVSKLKKAYSNLANMIKLSELDNGALATWDFPTEYTYQGVDTEFFKKYFLPYLNVSTKYGYYSSEKIQYPIHNIDGDSANYVYTWYRLSDGTSITIFTNGQSEEHAYYMWVFIDLNNSNPPNRLGKDVFMFGIYKKFRLWGQGMTHPTLSTLYACKKGTGQKYAGGYCGVWIQESGWEIPDGYPW